MIENLEDKNFIFGAVDRFEGDLAIVKLDDGQEILWPEEKLPSGVSEGSVIKLKIFSSISEEKEREKLAKAVLSEILKIEEN